MTMNEPEKRMKRISVLLKSIAGVSGVFSIIVCSIIILNYLQLRSVDPLNSPLLEDFIKVYREQPENAQIKEEIRGLDLLIRKAFFTQQWQIKTGGYLLAGGLALFLLSLAFHQVVIKKIPLLPRKKSPENIGRSRFIARLGIILLFGGIVSATIVVLVFSDAMLSTYPGFTSSPDQAEQDFPSMEIYSNNWPSFRGPFGNGNAPPGKYPVDWNGTTGDNIVWKTTIPRKGFNSPILWEDRIFLAGADETAREVYCLEAGSGEILWQVTVDDLAPGKSLPEVSKDTGYAAPSMATNGESVFALFTTGMLFCFDFNGTLLWTRDLGIPENIYGHSSSLISYQNMLFVQYDQEESAAIMALDTKTGRTLWSTPREVLTSWASPIIARNKDTLSVVLNANPLVAAYDLYTGKELWTQEIMMGEVAPSCTSGCGLIFAANQFASLVALDAASGEIKWEYYDDLPNVSSPCATDSYVFLPTNYGVVTTLDCLTGEVLWIHEFDEGFYSSPIAVDQYVYILDMKGKMSIFKASGEFISVGSPELGEDTVTTPAFGKGFIYVRGENQLFCIGESS